MSPKILIIGNVPSDTHRPHERDDITLLNRLKNARSNRELRSLISQEILYYTFLNNITSY